jgi:heme exporter protein B
MSAFPALVVRDVRLSFVEGGALGTALGFYLVVIALLPLGLGPDLQLLGRIAAGVLWIALLLAALLSAGRLFEADAEDGSLDVFAMAPLPLEAVAAAKTLAHWLTVAVPLAILAPVLGLMLNLNLVAMPVLVATMLIGTPAVSAIGTLGAALTLKARRSGVLLALIVLPLYVPTLVFGIATVTAAIEGPPGASLAPAAILGAISLVALVGCPWAAAAALRAQLG